MDTKDSEKVSKEEVEEEKPGKKWKREVVRVEETRNQRTDAMPLPLSPVQSQPPLEEKMNDITGENEGEVQVKNRIKAEKNFNVRTATMGIFREAMNPQILVDNLE